MGIVSAPSKILVTGANGFIAMWVVDTLLRQGYAVRAVVRSREKVTELGRFQDYIRQGKFESVLVEDITKEGAFDAAVKDVEGIIHMASPVALDADDPQELIVPAISGSLGILKSALKHGRSLKRIVFTSSTAAVVTAPTKPTTFNESNWNDLSVAEVEKLGRNALPGHKYRASKTLAEKAVWEFYEKHKANVPWDVSALNPPFVFGPALNGFPTPSHQNATTKMWWDYVVANPPTPESVSVFNCWVDVRDLALAHVLALQRPDAGGERIIISAGPFVWQDWHDIASTHRSPLKSNQFLHHQELDGRLPRGFPDIARNRLVNLDNSKALRILGPEITFRSKEETTKDILHDYATRGW